LKVIKIKNNAKDSPMKIILCSIICISLMVAGCATVGELGKNDKLIHATKIGNLMDFDTAEAPVNGSQTDSQIVEELPSPVQTPHKSHESAYNPELEENDPIISDPLEPVNRVIFAFNDKLYFWLVKPVLKGYSTVAPTVVRAGINNLFSNLGFPIRFVNCLLQAKFSGAGYEFERFFINSTLGLAGFIDIADKEFGVKAFNEDFGQTLGLYGLGHGFYINWPFIGPCSALDTIGLAGDYVLTPGNNTDLDAKYRLAVKGYTVINNTSLNLGDYEILRNSAIDPYVALRNVYIQIRQNRIKQ
jgi:phospholipid-binding lipoprotein MlaA